MAEDDGEYPTLIYKDASFSSLENNTLLSAGAFLGRQIYNLCVFSLSKSAESCMMDRTGFIVPLTAIAKSELIQLQTRMKLVELNTGKIVT